ncbi:hypothetical protein IC582_008985 [Cucumis melo]|uniref:Uncharacterized protein At5g39865 n=2 Tax=Cucumis melo TaxID=3656 RepID=A0A1S3B769_CUCME|nr:uncharacterized protein At5g39865 [Cucumis melo]KAA0053864.1 Glutaredoxin [Cucumis melo var. makuwa]TYK25539.1 Glutaredoxin [Cucumis melo var. makuwa]
MGCSASRPITFPSTNPESSSSSSPPVPRAFSLPTPLIHHPPISDGDTNHLVTLTSTTYGSLLLIDRPKSNPLRFYGDQNADRSLSPHTDDSDHALSPDSVINTWELMDGLDDAFDLSSDVVPTPQLSIEKTPFKPDGSVNLLEKSVDSVAPSSLVKPLWQHLSEEALLAKLDPNVVFSYRRALSSRQLGSNGYRKNVKSVGSSPVCSSFSNNWLRLPGGEDKVVIYFTSLRGIRKTYEDCCSIRTIFRGFRVPVDERDISMDSSYRKELQSAIGGKTVSLPQVFIRGKYIGGAEEIKQLNEYGELGKLLVGFPVWNVKSECERCGEARFLPCPNCYGSRKVFKEDEGELRRCPDCNENGLIKCPDCCF